MGEIKSTLDLVMERTRHLSLSAEERAQQQRDDFEKRLQGLLQQYEDGALPADGLEKRIAGLQSELKMDDARLVVAGVVKRIDPDQDNRARLALLAPALATPIAEVLSSHRVRRAEILAAGQARALDHLRQVHDIRGSAVIANPQRDPGCLKELDDLRQKTEARLAAVARQTA